MSVLNIFRGVIRLFRARSESVSLRCYERISFEIEKISVTMYVNE